MFIAPIIYHFIVWAWNLHWSIPTAVVLLGIFFLTNWSVQRRPEVVANGFMEFEKGKEVAPKVFKKK